MEIHFLVAFLSGVVVLKTMYLSANKLIFLANNIVASHNATLYLNFLSLAEVVLCYVST